MPYEELSHTADLRIKVYGNTIESLFKEGVYALYNIVFLEKPICQSSEYDDFFLESLDLDMLFHDFLDEILYITFVKKRKICQINLHISANSLHCHYSYEPFDPTKEVKKEVKAITYHNLHIQKNKNFYETEVVMDV